jgi:hypothetical protein
MVPSSSVLWKIRVASRRKNEAKGDDGETVTQMTPDTQKAMVVTPSLFNHFIQRPRWVSRHTFNGDLPTKRKVGFVQSSVF